MVVVVNTTRPSIVQCGRQKIVMATIEAGDYVTGSDDDEMEQPSRRIRITSPYLLAVHPVTQSLYRKIVGELPLSAFLGADDRPVDTVTWHEAVRFCNLLSHSDGIKPYYDIGSRGDVLPLYNLGYRLPTEAEWEHACRSGSLTKYCYGDDSALLGNFAWFAENALGETHDVGKLLPNTFGLHDMHGNVWEWCWDWHSNYKPSKKAKASLGDVIEDPIGPDAGRLRVIRGGCWGSDSQWVRSSARHAYYPDEALWHIGFRVARNLENKATNT